MRQDVFACARFCKLSFEVDDVKSETSQLEIFLQAADYYVRCHVEGKLHLVTATNNNAESHIIVFSAKTHTGGLRGTMVTVNLADD